MLQEEVVAVDNMLEDTSSTKSTSFLCGVRFKTFIILTALFALMYMCFVGIIVGIIIPKSVEVENFNVNAALLRTTRGIYDQFNTVISHQVGYAAYNVPYEIVVNITTHMNCEEFLLSDYTDSNMISLGIDLVLHYNLKGDLICGRALSEGGAQIPNELIALSASHPLMANVQDINNRFGGFMTINSSILQVVAIPLQTPTYEGPSTGLLVWGSYLSSATVQNLADREQLCVTFNVISSNPNTNSVDDILTRGVLSAINSHSAMSISMTDPEWNNTLPIVTQTLPDIIAKSKRQCWDHAALNASVTSRMSAVGILPDVFGNKKIILRSDIDRDSVALMNQALGVSLGLVGFTCLIALVTTLLYMQFGVVNFLVKLSSNVKSVTKSINMKQRLPKYNGKNELVQLASNINFMLEVLDDNHQLLSVEHAKLQDLVHNTSLKEQFLRSMMNSIQDFLLVVKPDGVIIQTNTSFLEKMTLTPQDVVNKMSILQVLKGMSAVEQLEEMCGNESENEFSIVCRFGVELNVVTTVSKVETYFEENLISAFVVVARDVSEETNLKSKLERDRLRMLQLSRDFEFNEVINNPHRKKSLNKYCCVMKCEENIKFIDVVRDYKNTKRQQHRSEKQQIIYDAFLRSGSDCELNVPESDKVAIQKGYGQVDLFDNLYEIVKGMIMMDIFPRWREWDQDQESTGTSTIADEDTISDVELESYSPSSSFQDKSRLNVKDIMKRSKTIK
ncbi:RGS21 [Acrasis kona]|uniref:RGS21 n=1 Tax=Acrasis kona TaxID=1008807 RepID=A0AAW2Z5H6_9EUKA